MTSISQSCIIRSFKQQISESLSANATHCKAKTALEIARHVVVVLLLGELWSYCKHMQKIKFKGHSVPKTERKQKDGRTGGQTDGQTDGHTDGADCRRGRYYDYERRHFRGAEYCLVCVTINCHSLLFFDSAAQCLQYTIFAPL